jgi:hypothetical protein
VSSVIVVALIGVVFAIVLLRVDVDLSGGLTSGDLLVGIGTLGLAWYTAQLASATYWLDERNVERERARHDRQVRGVALLVDQELKVVKDNATAALYKGAWPAWYATPHGAWARDGAIIAERVSKDVTESLVLAFSFVGEWEKVVTQYFLLHPTERTMPNSVNKNKDTLGQLLGAVRPAREKLDGAVALLSGAEAKSNVPWLLAQHPRLRRILFWPRTPVVR